MVLNLSNKHKIPKKVATVVSADDIIENTIELRYSNADFI
jgi:hypothetical protein